MKDKLEEIKKITEDVLRSLGWEVEIETEITEKIIFLKIDTEEPSLLIGRGGENLDSLQHILRLIINKRLGEFIHLIVDVANYRGKRQIFLEQDSLRKALEVKETGKEQELEPMSSFERRIVHMALQKIDGISSEGVGDGRERRIVIRPE